MKKYVLILILLLFFLDCSKTSSNKNKDFNFYVSLLEKNTDNRLLKLKIKIIKIFRILSILQKLGCPLRTL